MSNTIKDGAGAGYSAKVDAKKRLHTSSVSRSERDAAIQAGRFYIMSTQKITLTDDNITPMLYFKNNDPDRDLFIDIVIVTTGPSTGGTGAYLTSTWGAIDDSSTIVSEAKTVAVINAKIGSSEVFNGNIYKGESGDTIVNGTNISSFVHNPGDKTEFEARASIPNGNHAMIAITPPTGNTSMEAAVTLTVWYLDEDLAK